MMAARKRTSALQPDGLREAQTDEIQPKKDEEEPKERKIVEKLSERERTRRIWIIYFIGFMVSESIPDESFRGVYYLWQELSSPAPRRNHAPVVASS